MSGAAGAAGAAAAAEQQRRMREEEEEMTPYSPQDLAEDWEFKILRSSTAGFRNPVHLRQVLDDEARAGWVLVEKFDNSRIRLKRPARARDLDGKLSFDPYRSHVGPSPAAVTVAIVGVVLAVVFGILVLAASR